ncbi:Coenzyme F420:L-glutamate ligase [uncultured archaeon]|nr:Coenzyme F420:L-glutamate ligase [uncultured archaeon]
MQLQEAIKKRKSSRKFSEKKIELSAIIRAIQNINLSPCAGNYYNLRFIIVQKESTLDKIAEASQQDFIKKATAAIAVVSDREKVKKMYDYNDKGFGAQQAGAAIQTILLSLTEANIANCWVGFFDDDQVNDALGVKGQTVEAIIAVGLPSKDLSQKKKSETKMAIEDIIFFEKYGKSKTEPQPRVRGEWT